MIEIPSRKKMLIPRISRRQQSAYYFPQRNKPGPRNIQCLWVGLIGADYLKAGCFALRLRETFPTSPRKHEEKWQPVRWSILGKLIWAGNCKGMCIVLKLQRRIVCHIIISNYIALYDMYMHIISYHIVLHYITLYYVILYYIILYYIKLYYIILYHIIFPFYSHCIIFPFY